MQAALHCKYKVFQCPAHILHPSRTLDLLASLTCISLRLSLCLSPCLSPCLLPSRPNSSIPQMTRFQRPCDILYPSSRYHPLFPDLQLPTSLASHLQLAMALETIVHCKTRQNLVCFAPNFYATIHTTYQNLLQPLLIPDLTTRPRSIVQFLHLAAPSNSSTSLHIPTLRTHSTLQLSDLAPHSNSSRQASLCHLTRAAIFLLSY